MKGLFDLSGRRALVTGASRGIGRALAEGLADAGCKVIGIGRSECPEGPFRGTFEYRAVDVRSDLSEVFALAAGPERHLHCLINCAGISVQAADNADLLARFAETVDVNLTATHAVCMAARPFMREGASIINVTSIGSVLGFPGNPGYVASKGGLRLLTRALAVDFGPFGIRVNALAPGYIRTAMTALSHEDPTAHERRRAHTCLGRWGCPEDLVGAAIFLASDASAYVTGTDLFVDGGWTAKGLVA